MSTNRTLSTVFAVQEKNLSMMGKSINIAGINKSLLAEALYRNLQRDKFIDPYQCLLMLHQFKKNNYSLDWYDCNLYIDLSEDTFDPSEYDRTNKTYYRDDIQTAYQCVDWVKEQVLKYQENKKELLILLNNLFNKINLTFNSDGNLFIVDKDEGASNFRDLLSIAVYMNKIGVSMSVKDGSFGQFKKPHLEMGEPLEMVVEKIKLHLLKEAMNNNYFKC